MSVIELNGLTKDYGENRGIFDIDLAIGQGEMVGFVGTNGSGKTTTIRSILGFIKPTSGTVKVNGLTSWEHSSEIVKNIGYVPGEIAFPDLKTGVNFLKSQAEFLGLSDMTYANSLIERLQLDPRANLKRMSKGMKQKTALVAALMADLPILILDEPTTGLDPLMRVTFLDIIKEEHAKGKTIFISSHLYEELETTCDRVALINNGQIEFLTADDYNRFANEKFKVIRRQEQYHQLTVSIPADGAGILLKTLKGYSVKFISEIPYTLETHFKKILMQRQGDNKNVQ